MRSALTRACARAESLERRTLLSFNPISVDPLDKSFGGGDGILSGVGQDSTATAVASQPDGKLVAVGFRYTDRGQDFVVARYNADGTVDTSFGGGGRVFTDFEGGNDQPRAVTVLPDGRIVVAGISYLFTPGNDTGFAV